MGCTTIETGKSTTRHSNFSIFKHTGNSVISNLDRNREDDCYCIAGMNSNKVTVCKHGALGTSSGRTATQEVARLYKVHDQMLGAGAFGRVYLAESKMNKENKFAIKIVPLKSIGEEVKEQMREELQILNKLDHPYVAKYERAFEDENYIYIIMTLI